MLKVQYQVGDSSATDNAMKPNLRIVNEGGTAVSLNQLKIRYWFTENAPGFNYFCDYAQAGCGNITGQVASAGGDEYYLEIGFTNGAGSVAAGANSGTIKSRISSTNWANLNETNDYSYDASKLSFTDWNQVTLYLNGALVWGVEPGGTVPTATATSQSPTATATVQSPTATATTPVTPIPPTATPVTGASCSVSYVITNQWGNGFQANVTITNLASSAVQGYTLTWDFLNGETVNDGWNATFSQSGTTATVSNPAGYWNGMISANGGTSSFGFTGSHNGIVAAPTNFSLNGTPCN